MISRPLSPRHLGLALCELNSAVPALSWTSPSTQARNFVRSGFSLQNVEPNPTSSSERPLGPFNSMARQQLEGVVAPKLGIMENDYSAWYTVSYNELVELGCGKMLARTNFSPGALISAAFPEHAWSKEKFLDGTKVMWKRSKNQRAFLEYVSEPLGLEPGNLAAWYTLSIFDLLGLGGQAVLEATDFKLPALLKSAFPEHKWDNNLFTHKPRSVSPSADRAFFLELGERLGIKAKNLERWYSVPYSALIENGAEKYLRRHSMSRYHLLSAVFPEHKWHPLSFKGNQKSSDKESLETLTTFARFVEKELRFRSPEDWHYISKADLIRINAPKLFRRKSQAEFLEFLQRVYPDIDWDVSKFVWSSSGGSDLRAFLDTLFRTLVLPAREYFTYEILTSNSLREAVFVIPVFNLLVEYQGPIAFVQQIAEKNEIIHLAESVSLKRLSERNGFTLIRIPFWWNRSREAIVAELWKYRPDLFEPSGPLSSFEEMAQSSESIPGSVPLKSLTIPRGLIQRWSTDPRFSHYFKSDSE